MSEEQEFFAILPEKMVLEILQWLDHDSMLVARECCVLFETLLTTKFENSSLFKFKNHFELTSENVEHNWVFKTNKKMKNLCFSKYNFDKVSDSDFGAFWNLHGANIIYLDLSDCYNMLEGDLDYILDKVINLKTFKLWESKLIDGAKIICKLYDRCVKISLNALVLIDRKTIIQIAADRQTTIKELTLSIYLPDNHLVEPFKNCGIYQLLKRLQPKLKRLYLYPDLWGDNCYQHIAQLNLNLTEFNINGKINNHHVLIAIQMKNLQKLSIDGRLSDEHANLIYNNMHELRSLSLECFELTNEGVINVTKLKKLEDFSIKCPNIDNEGIVNGIASKKNHMLKKLNLIGRFSDDMLISIVNNLPELERLSLSDIFISPHLIPLIYERLTNLKQFYFNSLKEPLVMVKNLPEPKLQNANVKISELKYMIDLSLIGSIPGATLADICEMSNLRRLLLHDYKAIGEMKDEMIQLLTKLKSLRKVSVYCNDFLANEDDWDDIRKAKSKKTTFKYKGKLI